MRSSLLYNDEGRRDICHEGFRNEILPGKAGLITEWTTWQKGLSTNGATTLSDTYAYSYDKAGRLLGSVRYSGSSATPLSTLTESGISYDDSGNLTAIKRYGESSGTEPVDDLAFSYTGTRRTGYSYDAHGNVTQDSTNGTILAWNILGLPKNIADSTDATRRIYAADGTLLAVYEVAEGGVDGDGYVYLGNMVFNRSQVDGLSLESGSWEGGLLLPGTTRTSVLYRITDHLGSVRAVRDAAGKVRQRFDYYPFGTVSGAWSLTGIPDGIDDEGPEVPGEPVPDPTEPIIAEPGSMAAPLRSPRDSFEVADPGLEIWIDDDPVPAVPPQSVLRWRFGGKEIAGQRVGASVSQSGSVSVPAGTPAAAAGRPYLDFGARLYDPRTAAWLSQDPLSEKYYPVSPYAYCAGNPISLIDEDGLDFVLFGANESSIIFRTDLLEFSIDVSGFGLDWGGNYTLDGTETLSAALDLAGFFDPSGIADGANAALLASEGDYWGAIQSGLSVLPLGDLAKVSKIGKDIRIIGDAISASNKGYLHRPYIRKRVREVVESKTPRDEIGRFLDANTRAPISGKYDLGHVWGKEYWRLKADAEAKGLTQKEFNELMNNPDLYQIEDPHINRSRRYEKKK